MRQWSVGSRGFVWALCALAAQAGLAQGFPASPAARNWAWDQVKTWSFSKQDARGQTLWTDRTFLSLGYAEQTEQLIGRLDGDGTERRAALILLSERPLDRWARPALHRARGRDEAALVLYVKGYRYPDKDPFVYLEPSARVDRPWTQGMGLHLDAPGAWRFQWISSPALLPRMDALAALPKALEQAPQPGAILHLRQLRPGLLRLQALAGGREGIVPALAQGSRAGFYVRHVERWLKQSSAALGPLASREAWVLHYGLPRREGGPEGTLVFLPGDLPTRTRLALELLKLNPTSMGARSRAVTWTGAYGGKASVTQVRGSGGVLHVCAVPGGTWISDREAPLRSVLFPVADVTLGERAEWCRVALAGMRKETEVSLWLVPRLGAGAAFERTAIRRRLLDARQQAWNNPAIAKAAPRAGTLSVSLGAGPTEALLDAVLRRDQEAPIDDPEMPVVAEDGQNLTPGQLQGHAAGVQVARDRRAARKAMRDETTALQAMLDLRGAAFHWRGWVAAPPLTSAEKAAMAEFRKLQREDPYQASRRQAQGKAGFYGGYGDPGMAPSAALAVPVQAGKAAALEAALGKLWPRLFKGRAENREHAKGVLLHRIRTGQAFVPAWAVVNGTLVVGSDDAAVQAVAGGLLGQTTTLADLQSRTYGIAYLDGPSTARNLEMLLLAYLRVSQGGGYWWFGDPAPTEDEAAAEVASTFGPFLGAVKALGTRTLELEWTSAGLEARPR